ncbi:MAG TPA: glycosyltransferase family 4 protein [Candidatus Levybacteria bacterium]|nr:glycosyltransferase family 4 protein [Candidatus Levybacteria bacterium]
MKLLYFTYDFPVPITSGGKNRAYHMLKYGKGDIDITLFSFYREVPRNDAIAAVEDLGITNIRLFKRSLSNFKSIAENPLTLLKNMPTLTKVANPTTSITKKLYFKSDVLKELVKTVKEEKIDVVHFESLYTAYYFSPLLKEMGVQQVFGTENIEYKVYEEYAKTAVKKVLIPLYLFESQKIKKDEKRLLQLFDHTMAVSKEDADVISQITSKPCEVIENGVDITTFAYRKRKKKDTKVLLFVGNFSYFPNIPAIKNFYNQVFQHLEGDYELRIIGKDVQSLGIDDKRVSCVEYVTDIRDEYYAADAFVFPIRIGGGTNFKIIESMACGLPVIGYGDRLTTMGIDHKKEAVIVQNGKEFTVAIKTVTSDSEASELMSHRAREFVEERYSWEVIGKNLHTHWKRLIKNEKS